MKILIFSLLASVLIFTGCDNDDECNAGNLETNIVGNWNVTSSGLPLGDIEFRANGTFVDQSGVIIPDSIGGIPITSKTYSVQSNEMLTLTAGTSFASVDFAVAVTSYTCDEIIVVYQANTLTMRRDE